MPASWTTAGADVILVGDSVANNVLGYEDTLHVTIDDMARHTAAVARARPRCLVVGDMPWMSYHLSVDEAVRNAATLVRAGAGAVKLEGGRSRLPAIEAIVRAEIPVMGHIGLTPQSVLAMGGYRVQAKSVDAAQVLLDAAKALAAAGCFAIVLEGVPDLVAAAVTEAIDVPTIGIGAGAGVRRPGPRLPRPARPREPHAAQVRPAVRQPGRGGHGRRGRLRRRRAERATSRARPRATTPRPSFARPCSTRATPGTGS